MFRSFNGFKFDYHGLTLLVVAEFNEWKVLVYGHGVTIHGTRQFEEAKAKEHALAIAESYALKDNPDAAPPASEPGWQPTSGDDWLVWRA